MITNYYGRRLVYAMLVCTSHAESQKLMQANDSDAAIDSAHTLDSAAAASETGSDTPKSAPISAIIGGAAGGFILISLIAILLVMLWRNRRSRRAQQNGQDAVHHRNESGLGSPRTSPASPGHQPDSSHGGIELSPLGFPLVSVSIRIRSFVLLTVSQYPSPVGGGSQSRHCKLKTSHI
jgi:hypothetical protein